MFLSLSEGTSSLTYDLRSPRHTRNGILPPTGMELLKSSSSSSENPAAFRASVWPHAEQLYISIWPRINHSLMQMTLVLDYDDDGDGGEGLIHHAAA